MTTVTATKPPKNGETTAVIPSTERAVEYVPLAESEPIKLGLGTVRNTLAVKSRSGRDPGDGDLVKFIMLCKSRRLNPFVGDAYLLGYDTKDGGTQWSLITAIQALRKRAEGHPQFDGCRRGIILMVDGQPVEREGSLLLDGEQLVGGWSVCQRKDNSVPFRETVKFSVYSTGRSRWEKDPAGMIAKVAEAAALRRAFPSDLAGLYIRDEFGSDESPARQESTPQRGLEGLKSKLTGMLETKIEPQPPDDDADVVQPEPPETFDAGPEDHDDSAQAPPDESAIVKYFRSTLSQQKGDKRKMGNVLKDAAKQCDADTMMELQAYAEDLAAST